MRQHGISECPSLALVRPINLKAELVVRQNLTYTFKAWTFPL